MKYEIKSVSIWSVIRVSFFVNLVIGFLVGILYAGLLSIVLASAASAPQLFGEQLDLGPLAAGVTMILVPVIFAFLAAVFNTLLAMACAVVYNLLGRTVGGLELTLESSSVVSVTKLPESDALLQTETPPPPPPVATSIPFVDDSAESANRAAGVSSTPDESERSPEDSAGDETGNRL
jgi:hypothetical protein